MLTLNRVADSLLEWMKGRGLERENLVSPKVTKSSPTILDLSGFFEK